MSWNLRAAGTADEVIASLDAQAGMAATHNAFGPDTITAIQTAVAHAITVIRAATKAQPWHEHELRCSVQLSGHVSAGEAGGNSHMDVQVFAQRKGT